MLQLSLEAKRLRETCRYVTIELIYISYIEDRAEIEKHLYSNFYLNNSLDSCFTYADNALRG